MVVSLYLLFEILSILFCIHFLYDEKFVLDKITILFLVVELTWMHIIYYSPIDNKFAMFIYPIIAIYCGIRFEPKIKTILINNVLYMVILSFIQASVMQVFLVALKLNEIGEKESLLINILVFFIVISILYRCKLFKLSMILQSNDKIAMLSLGVLMIGVAFLFVDYRKDKGLDVIGYAILIISTLLIVVSAIDIGKHKIKAKEMEAELRLHRLYEDSFRGLIDDIRAKQHEFDNHINTIYSQHYLYSTYEELVEVQKKYCNSIVQANKYNKLLSKGNSIILGFLYSKFSEAEKLGIDVEYKIKIGEMKSNVPIHKVIELLGNLITNAIESLSAQEDMNKLRVIMIEQPYEIAIDISNECKNINQESIQNFFKKGYSEKGKKRGYGLYNVSKICEEYDIVLEPTVKREELVDRLHFTLIINKPL